jgi:hypothetical protein
VGKGELFLHGLLCQQLILPKEDTLTRRHSSRSAAVGRVEASMAHMATTTWRTVSVNTLFTVIHSL